MSKDILKLNPRDVKKFGISRQTLWNVKNRIGLNQTCKISNKTKKKFIQILYQLSSF